MTLSDSEKTRYMHDPTFKQVVDAMVSVALDFNWTTVDFMAALEVVHVLVQQENVRRLSL